MKPEHTISYTDQIRRAQQWRGPCRVADSRHINHSTMLKRTNHNWPTFRLLQVLWQSAAHTETVSHPLINDARWRIAENIDTIIIQYINLIKAT